MNKRLVWLAPIALAALLSGCSVTLTTTGPIAPSDLVESTIVFSHDRQQGAQPPNSGKYHFNSAGEAFDAGIHKAHSWTYARADHDSATVTMVFKDSGSAALRVTCELTFDSRDNGAHECDYVYSASIAFVTFTSEGASSGTFLLRAIGSDGP